MSEDLALPTDNAGGGSGESGIGYKDPCKVVISSNQVLTGIGNLIIDGVIDGVTLAAGDRVLVMGQTDPTENGVYVVSDTASTAPSRASDFETADQFVKGTVVFITSGTVNAGRTFTVSTKPTTIGTDSWLWNATNNANTVSFPATESISAGDVVMLIPDSGIRKFKDPWSNPQTVIDAASSTPGSYAAAYDGSGITGKMLFGYELGGNWVLQAATLDATGILTTGSPTIAHPYSDMDRIIVNVGADAWCVFTKADLTDYWYVYGVTTSGTTITAGIMNAAVFGSSTDDQRISAVYSANDNVVIVLVRSAAVDAVETYVVTMNGSLSPTVGSATSILTGTTLTRDIKIALYSNLFGDTYVVVAAGNKYRAGHYSSSKSMIDSLGNILTEPIASPTVFIGASNPVFMKLNDVDGVIDVVRNYGDDPVNVFPVSLAYNEEFLVFVQSVGLRYSGPQILDTARLDGLDSIITLSQYGLGDGSLYATTYNKSNGIFRTLTKSSEPNNHTSLFGLSQKQNVPCLFADNNNAFLAAVYQENISGDLIVNIIQVENYKNFLGIAQTDAGIGVNCEVSIRGSVSSVHDGGVDNKLETGVRYYIDTNSPSNITTEPDDNVILGISMTAGKIAINSVTND